LVEQHLHVARDREDVLVGVGRERVQIEEEVVGMLDVLAPRMQRVHLDAAEVGDVQHRGRVVHDEVVDHPGLGILREDLAAMDPVRRVGRRGLLVEERALGAVRHPLHREGTPAEMGTDQVGHVRVVRDQVSLRVPLGRPEDLREVRQPQVPAIHLHEPGVALLPGVERDGEVHREGATSRPSPRSWRHRVRCYVEGSRPPLR
jgi:hypothetical protein